MFQTISFILFSFVFETKIACTFETLLKTRKYLFWICKPFRKTCVNSMNTRQSKMWFIDRIESHSCFTFHNIHVCKSTLQEKMSLHCRLIYKSKVYSGINKIGYKKNIHIVLVNQCIRGYSKTCVTSMDERHGLTRFCTCCICFTYLHTLYYHPYQF